MYLSWFNVSSSELILVGTHVKTGKDLTNKSEQMVCCFLQNIVIHCFGKYLSVVKVSKK